MPKFLEFFAGAGMVKLGLGDGWHSLFANDIDSKKAKYYRLNFGENTPLVEGDISKLTAQDIPKGADLAWASFPCQDLSLAGNGLGFTGVRSSTFWEFFRLINEVNYIQPIPLLVIENVIGLMAANGGRDFEALLSALVRADYSVAPLVIDAVDFLPQSRPRLFVLCVHREFKGLLPKIALGSDNKFQPMKLRHFAQKINQINANAWLWLDLSPGTIQKPSLREIIELHPKDVRWHSKDETEALLKSMSEIHQQKIKEIKIRGEFFVGTIYKRTRNLNGEKRVFAELRTDQVAGCLRTPAGGSSRQILLFFENAQFHSRLLSGREAARLMGVPDTYNIPTNLNETLQLMGDGVVVSVVSWINETLLKPMISSHREAKYRLTG